MAKLKLLFIPIAICILTNCTTKLPKECINADEEAITYPDVKEVTIPRNIAPLNFIIDNRCSESIVELKVESGENIIVKGNSKNEIIFDEKQWRSLLKETTEDNIECTTYIKVEKTWKKLRPFKINIIDEPIDSFVTYRLIEPSFMSTGQIGLYQFDLTTGEETPIMRRCQNYTTEMIHDQSCVNCHTAQKGKPQNKMFYYRGKDGGLILTYNGKISKINTKVERMFGGTTYPAWHPELPYIVFSENEVYQDFPTLRKGKTELYDRRADLILYDIEKNEIYIINESKQLETNPSWSRDGEYLYFALSDSMMKSNIIPEFEYPKLKYDIVRSKFNPETKKFSKPELMINMTQENRSATFPRVSHDNRFLMTVISDFGASTHTHIEADLYVLDLKTNKLIKCEGANSDQAESYHDFSSNANWFVFYSRREDGNYGRAYISYIDSTGKCTKPFKLPHKDPQMDRKRLKLYNMIEFANSPVIYKESDFYDVLWNKELIQAQNDSRNTQIDGETSATKIANAKNNTDGNTGATKRKNEEMDNKSTHDDKKGMEDFNKKYDGEKNIHGE